jgi:GTP-binding protein HflX
LTLLERPDTGGRAVLVHLELPDDSHREDLREFEELVHSSGIVPVALVTGSRHAPDAKFFVGTGKLEQVIETVAEHEADMVILNHAITPSQERNLEKALQKRVLDRTGLILLIFAQRARTHEGKLQIELAGLQHQKTRLVRGWTHLERQKGGIGLRGGPGETQLELDRRMLDDKIKNIEKRLEKVRQQRGQSRRGRQRANVPTLALVGYTNAGKSTLFNHLTEADVYAADQLFATLDPTMRRVDLPSFGRVVLADTVGFIRHLPHKLINAFRATLEEAAEADLLLHVIDAPSDARADNVWQVKTVLEEIGAGDLPCLEIYNKIDLLDMQPRIDCDESGVPIRVWISAKDQIGFDLLFEAIARRLGQTPMHLTLDLRAEETRLRAALFASNAVLDEQWQENGDVHLQLRCSSQDLQRVLGECGISLSEAAQRWQIASFRSESEFW